MYSVGKGRRDSEVKILKDELRAKVKLRLHHAPYWLNIFNFCSNITL